MDVKVMKMTLEQSNYFLLPWQYIQIIQYAAALQRAKEAREEDNWV